MLLERRLLGGVGDVQRRGIVKRWSFRTGVGAHCQFQGCHGFLAWGRHERSDGETLSCGRGGGTDTLEFFGFHCAL